MARHKLKATSVPLIADYIDNTIKEFLKNNPQIKPPDDDSEDHGNYSLTSFTTNFALSTPADFLQTLEWLRRSRSE